MTEVECVRLLAARHLGRLATIVDHAPRVTPVNYRWIASAVEFCSQPGTKRDALSRSRVAFEIDEFDVVAHTGWSVQVVGWAAPCSLEGAGADAAAVPWCGLPDDPEWFRIHADLVTGRRIVRAPTSTEPERRPFDVT